MKNDHLSEALKEIPYNQIFVLEDMNPVSWDTLFIAKPYNYKLISDKNINMPSKISREIEFISYHSDGHCTLLFVKDSNLVNYSIIPRATVADFCFVDSLNMGLPSNTQFMIVPDSNSYRIVSVSYH